MAYDRVRNRVVLYGREHWSTGLLGDTWEWDGRGWVERTPASGPAPRYGHALVVDSG